MILFQQTEPEAAETAAAAAAAATNGTSTSVPPPPANNPLAVVMADQGKNQAKRLHVSNIPFRFRDPDLRAMFGVSFTYYV